MAITGSGTQADPFVVHSYAEIKNAMERSIADKYIVLANNINCNDYGEDFEWQAPAIVGSLPGTFHFDLDGHTIKNIKVKSGSSLFRCYYGDGSSSVYNGAILNVFLGNAVAFVTGDGGSRQNVSFVNLSISVDGTGVTGYTFYQCKFKNCAVWFQSSKLLNDVFRIDTSGVAGDQLMIENTDIHIEISNLNDKSIFRGAADNVKYLLSGVRLDGKVSGLPASATILWSVPQRHLLGIAVALQSTCANINSLSCPLDGTTSNGILAAICASIANQGNAVNKEITHSSYTSTADFNVDSAGIVNGDTLRNANFVVYNTVV